MLTTDLPKEGGMPSEKIHFTQERETLLITLYARALHSRSPDPILRDPWAEEAVSRIDYDFTKLKVRELNALSIAVRAKNFDLWTSQYLREHPEATVLYLGCGMDSRVYRVDPPASARWFDVDYPDVIALRQRLYPARAGYYPLGSSLADLNWLDQVPANYPAMIIAEGVMMYLPEAVVGPLLRRLTDHFPSGQMAFDAFNHLARQAAKADQSVGATGASFGWTIDDPQDIRQLAPRLDLIREFRTQEFEGYARFPGVLRAVVGLMDPFPALRRMNRVLLYRF
jgi:O-methyltransferase involved in polyketide biosynthesis